VAIAGRRFPAALQGRLGHMGYVRRLSGRLSWGILDQAMCSLTNFLLSVFVARALGAAEFGAFSLAYVTYGFAINASRGLSIEPLLIRFSTAELKIWRRATAGSTGTALLVGFATGALALLAGVLFGGTTGLAFAALGLMMPGLLVQDSWRYAFFAAGRGRDALINDTIWAAVQIPLLVYLKMSGHASVFWFIVAWGAGAVIGAAVGVLQARVVPSLVGATIWLIRHSDLGPRYLLENAGGNASDTVRSYGTSSILGIVAVGYIQAANVLMGPFKILYFGMSMITIPEATRVLRRSPHQLPLFCLAVSAVLTLLAVAWGTVLQIALPLGLGHLMLGVLWRPAYPLVLPTTLSIVAMCASTGAGVGLHALGAARRSLRAALLSAVIVVILSLGGAVIGGMLGAVSGAAAGAWFSTLIGWWYFRRALRELGTIPIPGWLVPSSKASRGKHHRQPPMERVPSSGSEQVQRH
jgi:O-antigen/teichoic acid export membrane protein